MRMFRFSAVNFFLFFILCLSAPVQAVDGDRQETRFPPKLEDGVYPHSYRPARSVDYQHLKLEFKVFMDELRLEGTAHYTFTPIHENVDSIWLHAKEMTVSEVASSAPGDLAWTYSDNKLYIDFSTTLTETEAYTLSISYEVEEPRDGLYFADFDKFEPEEADQLHTLSEPDKTRYWIPCFDYPSDRLQTEMVVTVPDNFTTLSNGELVGSKNNGDWRTDHWRQDIPHVTYLISLVVGEFAVIKDTWDGLPVTYYVETDREVDARPSFGKTPAMLEFFSDYYGYDYPYEKYAQVHVRNFHAGGMEHTTATTLYEWAVLDEKARVDRDMNWLIAHELAHQWFGDLVTCESWPELWLNEGFATYSECLWAEHDLGRDEFLYHLYGDFHGYFGESRRYTRPIVTNRFDEPYEMFDSHSYPKAGVVLNMLRNELGDALFRATLKYYLEQHAPGVVDTDDLREAIEAVSGRHLDRFFEQWIYRPGHPELDVDYKWLPDDGQAKLVIQQTQSMDKGAPPFAFALAVELDCGGETVTETLDIANMEETALIDCPSAPKSVVLNPNLTVLLKANFNKSRDMLLHELKHGSTVIVRVEAAKELKSHESDKVIEALNEAVLNDPFWGVRQEAARVLRSFKSETVMNMLLDAYDRLEESKVRREVVVGLGKYYKNKKVEAALRDIFKNDESDRVREAAVWALGKIDAENVYSLLKPGFSQESYRHIIKNSVIDTLTDLKEPKAFEDILQLAKESTAPWVRRNALTSIAKLARELAREEEPILDLLLRYLHSSSQTLQKAAIAGLRELRDEEAIADLRAIANDHPDKGVRNQAQGAIDHIRKQQNTDQSVENANEIDSLKENQKKMEDTIEALKKTIDQLKKQK